MESVSPDRPACGVDCDVSLVEHSATQRNKCQGEGNIFLYIIIHRYILSSRCCSGECYSDVLIYTHTVRAPMGIDWFFGSLWHAATWNGFEMRCMCFIPECDCVFSLLVFVAIVTPREYRSVPFPSIRIAFSIFGCGILHASKEVCVCWLNVTCGWHWRQQIFVDQY